MRCLLDKHPLPAGVAIFSLVFICFAIASGGQVAVIELKNRPADELIPVISPFLGPGDTLSGQDNLLFLSTTPENLARIQSIIAHLDQALQQLAITVVQGENAIDRLSTIDISGSVIIGDSVTAGVGENEESAARFHRHRCPKQPANQVQQRYSADFRSKWRNGHLLRGPVCTGSHGRSHSQRHALPPDPGISGNAHRRPC